MFCEGGPLKTASFRGNKVQYMFVFYVNIRNSGSFVVFSVDIVRQRENGLFLFLLFKILK